MPTLDHRSVHPCGADGEADHVTDGSWCWCNPRIAVPCPGCSRGGDRTRPDCPECKGEGLIDMPEFDIPGTPAIIIHGHVARGEVA